MVIRIRQVAAIWSHAVVDVALALVTFGGSVALLAHGGIGPLGGASGRLDDAGFALAAASTLPIVFWRRSPLVVFAMTGLAGIALVGVGHRIDLLLGPAAALYLLAASRVGDRPWTVPMSGLVLGLLVAYLATAALARGTLPDSELLHTGLAWSVAWFAGERTRLRREQVAELRARALRADRDAEQDRLLAVAEERARIARDLHDSAGHAINVIAIRAGAARLRHREDPDRSLAALAAIEEVARQTAADIDQIVGTLREPGSAVETVAAPVGLASLDTLITRHRDTGLPVTVNASGARRPLAPSVDQAAYRIAQEALTNAARHGDGGATIDLRYLDHSIELIVTNPVPDGSSPLPASGHGIVGMRERATLLGGTLDARRVNDTFRVEARLPFGGQPA
ncbi:MAG TPA: histidine kinase [Candidatus Limnocylindrales bacterium]|jgi:signal transduction histidine kinase|nr:histidine kinase [Candidatus Limnocylindrales bacterium]